MGADAQLHSVDGGEDQEGAEDARGPPLGPGGLEDRGGVREGPGNHDADAQDDRGSGEPGEEEGR